VSAYGIRAIFGFGALAWPGEPFVISGFVRSVPGPELARALEILATHACLAWLDSRELELPIESVARERARAATLERLLSLHDRYVLDARLAWEHQLESARAERELTAANVAGKLEEQNRQLRRTQRAMLNVIEDLREAREALASKVEQRTRELAAANELLQMRNRDLEEFVYIASHDLQEPLRTVAGYLQMVERRYGSKLGVEADEFIRFAIDGAHRMQALIESLLFYSRVATKDKVFERIALDDALDEALKNLARRIEETGATIERGPLPHLRGDRTQMVQLFQNLLANALKFAGDKPPRVHVTGELAAGLCTIRVRDEGIGFNPKYADRIFKVFRRLRRDTEGTGIGLAVCKKIVERHGGRIEAESSPGEGATFSAHFPIDPTREREGEP
jgi:signal transduction histidine kinase